MRRKEAACPRQSSARFVVVSEASNVCSLVTGERAAGCLVGAELSGREWVGEGAWVLGGNGFRVLSAAKRGVEGEGEGEGGRDRKEKRL